MCGCAQGTCKCPQRKSLTVLGLENAARAAQADLIRGKIEQKLTADLQKKREKLCRKNGGHLFESGVCLACGGKQPAKSGY